MDAISVIVRMISPEVAGLVPSHRIPLARRYAVQIVAVVHAHIVLVTVVIAIVPVGGLYRGRFGLGSAGGEAAAAHVGGADGGAGDSLLLRRG